ncbi:MAG: UDP-2,3-diacylglucosamine diphosphatase [Acidobacteriota bacterium]
MTTASRSTSADGRSIAVVADSHLGGPGGEGRDLVEQLRALPAQGCRHLVLLGDIFHVWVGSQKFETEEVRRVVPEIRALRAAGLRVDYVEGNRDFFLDRGPYADAFDSIVRELPLTLADGRRALAVHGDGLNDDDWRYRFWRWLSKSSPARALVLGLPGPIARRAVAGTEERLAQTNFKHRDAIPEAAIRAYARRRLAEGYDRLLLGHFHEPHRFDEGTGEIHLLDAWFRSRRVEWV